MEFHGTDVEQIRNLAEAAGGDLLRELLQMTVQQLMSADVDAQRMGDAGELLAQRNGYRNRRWDTRVGSIDLAIPKLRSGSNCVQARSSRRAGNTDNRSRSSIRATGSIGRDRRESVVQ